jgi:hypothetical protein
MRSITARILFNLDILHFLFCIAFSLTALNSFIGQLNPTVFYKNGLRSATLCLDLLHVNISGTRPHINMYVVYPFFFSFFLCLLLL